MTSPAQVTKPTRRDPVATKEALISSAVALFEERGYDNTSVQQVVDRANRTKGAYYHYFDSKEDLLFHIHDVYVEHIVEKANEVVKRDLPIDEKMRQFIIEVLLGPMGRYKSELTVYLQELRFLDETSFTEIKRKRDEFAGIFIDIIQQGVDEGVFKPVTSVRVVAFGIIGMAAWTHTWLIADGPLSPQEIGAIYADMVIDGLKT